MTAQAVPSSGNGGHCVPFAFPGLSSVGCVFGTALAGSMSLQGAPKDPGHIAANRKNLLRMQGLDRWAELHQVHGDVFIDQARATPAHEASILDADGQATSDRGLGLVIKTADCQPLFFAAGDGTAVAALHVGWRGNRINFPATGLRRFCEAYELNPEEVMAVRGPSLGPGAAEFINFEREWGNRFRPWFETQTQTMDLWRLTRDQLVAAGMRPERIFSLDLCTRSLPDVFFSYRLKHAGRQASLIWIKP